MGAADGANGSHASPGVGFIAGGREGSRRAPPGR
jgi:hypothetical protein